MEKSTMPKVLIVDDEELIRELIIDMIEMEVPRDCIVEASTGAEALEMVKTQDIGVIITDIKMPGMTGDQMLEALGDDIYLIPTLVVTGHGNKDLALQLFRLGAFEVLEKPFVPSKLLEVLKKAITKRRKLYEVCA